MIVKEFCRLPLDEFHGMAFFCLADIRIPSAHQTGAGKEMKILPFYGNSAQPAHIEIEETAERDVLVLDPMLATGGSAIDAITQIKKHGAKRIKFIGLLGAPEGIKALHEAHPDVDIYLGAQDDRLNENGYIVPGLGDAGDRIYGTK